MTQPHLARARPRTARLFVAAGCAMLAAFLTPGFQSFETPSLPTVRAMVSEGTFGIAEVDDPTYHRGADGRFYGDHEIGTALVAYPLALAAEGLARTTGADFKRVFELGSGLAGCVVVGLTVLLLLALGKELDLAPRRLLAPVLLLLLSSQYAIYATSLTDVAVSVPLAVGCALVWARADRGLAAGWLVAGLLAGALVITKLTNAPFLFLLVWLALSQRDAGAPRRLGSVALLLAGALPGIAVTLWWNAVRTGSPFETPYLAALHGFTARGVPAAFVGTFVSPNKGLLAYTPALLALPLAWWSGWTRGRRGRFLALVAGSLAMALLRLAGTAQWTGAGGWGIRYYVPWLPLLLLPVAALLVRSPTSPRRWTHRILWLLVALGLVVNIAGILTNHMYRQQACGYRAWSVTGMNACAVRALPSNLARTAGASIPEFVVPGASVANVFASNRLAVWWFTAQRAGAPTALCWTMGLLLLGGGALLLRSGTRALGRAEDAVAWPGLAPPGAMGETEHP